MQIKTSWLLVGILLVASFVRLFALGDVPAGLNQDEVSVGYSAYSFLLTGKDLYGAPWPFFFRTGIDFKNPVYIYAAVPAIALFGLNAFATRLPAAIFGILAILGLFLLSRELFGEHKALLAAGLLALSPWAIETSRFAVEATALPAFLLFGLYFFLRGLKESRWLLASAFCFGVMAWTYAAARIFLPFFLPVLLWIYRRELRAFGWKKLLPAGAFFAFFAVPLVLITWFYSAIHGARFYTVSIFASGHSLLEFLPNYLLHFSPAFLFLSGDAGAGAPNPQGFGILLAVVALLALAGVVHALLKRGEKTNKLLLAWLLLFPVAAGLTWQSTPSAVRTLTGMGLFELFAIVGVVALRDWLSPKLGGIAKNFFPVVGALLVLNALLFLNAYFLAQPPISIDKDLAVLPDAFAFIKQHYQEYGAFGVTPGLKQGFTYSAFYLALDPSKVQGSGYGNTVRDLQTAPTKPGLGIYLSRGTEATKGSPLHETRNALGELSWRVEEIALNRAQ
ncbi:MAG TPA: glycosyltransferase family 39 protein [Candidatus Norongarragalinales archaeon]|jgi:4-amino-4-deoxy-L-arabinose transferase-like glycosyltransferase|nr:glycosyltransferase family 39 protein [Candidatus Norongarragalinales archaeon]